MSQQQKQINCNGCGARIKFDQSMRSQSGKMIPIDFFSGQKHDCPARKQQAQNVPGEPRETTIAAQKTAEEYSDRSAAIQKAHDENIAASKLLTLAIGNLSAAIAAQTEMIEKIGAPLQKLANALETQKAGGAQFEKASEMEE